VAGSANQIVYKNASNVATGSTNFLFLNDSTLIVGAATSTGTSSQPLQVTGGAYVSGSLGIGTTNPTSKLTVQGDVLVSGVVTATSFGGNLKGGLTGNVIYQSAPDTTAFLVNGTSGFVLQSNGIGNSPTWVAAAPSGAVSGITVRDSSNNIIGTSGSVTQLTFGTGLSVTGTTGAAGIATITLSSNIVGSALSISGIATVGFITATNLYVAGVGTFLSSGLKIRNPANTFGYTITADAIVADRTLTLPLITGTDTIAVLGLNQTFSGSINFTNTLQASGGSQVLLAGSASLSHEFGTNQTSANLTFGGTSGSGLITFGRSTVSQQTDIQAGVTASGNTKTINLGTGGASGSFTQINIGPTAGIGTVVINSGTTLSVSNQIISTQANSTTTGGGQIYLNGATGNRIDFNTNGTAAPTFTTRSVGTKLVLYPSVSVGQVDYALGIESNALWSSIPDTAYQFKWYVGNTSIATLFGTGQLVLGTTSLTGTASQPLQVTGGAYVSGRIGVGTTNPGATLNVVPISTSIAGLFSGTTSSDMVRITQLGSGNALVVEDSANPDSSPFVVKGDGSVGIGTESPTSKLTVVGGVLVSGVVTATSFSGSGTNLTGIVTSIVAGTNITVSGSTGQVTINSSGVSISTNTTNQNQFIPYAIGTGSTTGLGVSTTGLVFNPSSGNVGIATTNPLQKLHVLGNLLVAAGSSTGQHITQKAYELNSGTLSWEGSAGQLFSITNNLTSGSIFSVNDVSGIPSIDVNANGTVSMVSYGGNLGIGTTNPTSKLHVVGNVNISGISTLGVTSATNLTTQQLNVSGLSTFAGITTHTAALFGTQASFTGIVTSAQLDLTASATASDSILYLSGAPTGSSGTNGLFGIGALSFSDTDIIADFTHSVNSYAQLVVQNKNSGSSSSADIVVNNDRSAGTTYYGDFGINGTTFAAGGPFGDVDGTYLYSAGGTLSLGSLNAYDVKIATNNTERVRIFSTGEVGIGTTTKTGTASQRLQVTGGAYVSGNLGIGTTNPSQTLHVQGNARVTGAVYDSTNSPGTSGQVLQSTVSGTQWTTAAAGGGGSGKFDTTIDNVLYVQPTGTLDIVGVGTTVTQITTLPAGSNKYLIHSLHVTNISNGDAEITAGFVMNARKVPATISVGGGAGINTITVGSASSIIVGMAVTGQGNIGETTGIGSTAGFQFNTYVTSVDGNNITLSKPIAGQAVSGTAWFSPVSKVSSRLPVPVGSAVELLKQPMVLNALDSIVLQSTGAGSGIGSTSTAAITQAANSNILTVAAGAAITNFLASGMLIQPTGNNTGIQTNTFVGVGYTPGALSIPITRPATVALASTSLSFTEVVVPQDGALQVTVVYQSSTDTSYLNGTGTVSASSNTTSVTAGLSSIPVAYYSTGTTYPSIIQSIRVSNISDGTIYPGGDYPVSVGIGNRDTIFSWLAYNMVIPKNSSIELCEAPKRIGIGQSIFAFSNTPYAIEIQIAGKQKTT
jgi:hypothetical protein